MGLFEGRSRVKRATTAPHSNLTLDVFITNNKLGKRVSKARMEPLEPDDEPPERRLRLNGGFLAPALRSLRQRAASAADHGTADTPLTNGHLPPPPTLRRHRHKYLTEVQKLMVNSECHKTEIFDSKLRHMPGRPAATPPHRNGERPRRRQRSATWDDEPAPAVTPAKKRATLDSLLLRDNHEYYKVEILSGKLRSSRRLSGDSDGPPHLEPEAPLVCDVGEAPDDSCDSFRVVRRGSATVRPRRTRFNSCGTPHGCRPSQPPAEKLTASGASSDDSNDGVDETATELRQIEFAFESVPDREQWFQTYLRENGGESVLGDVSEALAAAGGDNGPRLPYQMSHDELYPSEPPSSEASCSTTKPQPRAKHRRLRQLAETARKSPRCHASTRAARCSVDAAEGVALWESSLEQVQLVAAGISSLLTAAQEPHDPCSLAATVPRQGRPRRRRRTGSLSAEPAYDGELPAHLAGVPLAFPEQADLSALLRESAAPATAVRPRVVTEAAAPPAVDRRRRAGKRRKNRTGWPRSRTRRTAAAVAAAARRQRVVSRAVAAARAGSARRRAAR